MPISSAVIDMVYHQRLNVWTLCLIQFAWNCFTEYAPLVTVWMVFYLLSVASVIHDRMLIDVFYYSLSAISTRNPLLIICLKNCKHLLLHFYWCIHVWGVFNKLDLIRYHVVWYSWRLWMSVRLSQRNHHSFHSTESISQYSWLPAVI